MPRVKRGVTARARHKKVLALAKGFRGRRGNVYRIAKLADLAVHDKAAFGSIVNQVKAKLAA
jgi:ribosomal protein L20